MNAITSLQNETVKQARKLSLAKERRASGLHLIEGERLVNEALQSGATIETLFLEEGTPLPENCPAERILPVSRTVLESLCETRFPQHLAATVRTPDTSLPETFPKGLIVMLDRVQDAGNAGTILRSADAFGAAGILFGEGCADPFSGKCLRSAMGSTYHLPVWQGDLLPAVRSLRSAGVPVLCGHLRGSEQWPALESSAALVIGNEGSGVSDRVAEECILYRLPMKGRAESLNAAVAAGILLYELGSRLG